MVVLGLQLLLGGCALALRFTLSNDSIDTAIVGTTKLENAKANSETASAGPLPEVVVESLQSQFDELGADWNQQT